MQNVLDAIVVGAGAAGIGAAAVLNAGGASYVVLEASKRTGGRVKAFTFGEATRPVLLENGANWVSGAGPPPRWPRKAINPVYKLALALNFSLVRVPGRVVVASHARWAAVSSRDGPHVHMPRVRPVRQARQVDIDGCVRRGARLREGDGALHITRGRARCIENRGHLHAGLRLRLSLLVRLRLGLCRTPL